jgi:antagonist of KipI
MEMFRVLEPGPFTTIQDAGRYGYQQFGIPISGALDMFAFRVANLLVGNTETAAELECTFLGPRLEVLTEGMVAVTGADMPVLVNGQVREPWQSFAVKPGDAISFRPAKTGVRAYVAVAGGINVPEIMGSRSTFVGAKIGGLKGRALAKGDFLPGGSSSGAHISRFLPEGFKPQWKGKITLRAMLGPQEDYFDEGMQIFFNTEFEVASQADRMGYRLSGPVIPLKQGIPKTIISEPSLPGSVQVPPDGQPIIKMVELTVGGYAKIASVITPDLDLVAQARPGDLIRFTSVNLAEAHRAYYAYHEKLNRIRDMLETNRA